jgi:hypothetical protein
MMRRLAVKLGDLAVMALPRSRKAWGQAMMVEIEMISGDWAAAHFAAGCVIAGLTDRLSDFDAGFAAGLRFLALVSGAFALFHLRCAWGGARILLGRPDPFFNVLQRSDPAAAAAYHNAIPIVAGCFLLLGIAHLAGAYLLARGRFREFLFVWCAVVVVATLAVVVQLSIVWTLDGIPSEFAAPIVQSIGVSALLMWSKSRTSAPE